MVGLISSFLIVGALFALVGLVLGVLHLRRRKDSRRLGWMGVWFSVMALVATAGFLALYVFGIGRLQQQSLAAMRGETGGQNLAEWRGRPAPDFEFATIDGERRRLSEFRGKRVVLDFWATWCPPCVQEIPHFIRLRKELGTNDVVIVGLSREDRQVLKPFIEAKGINYPIGSVAEGQPPAPFGAVRAIPTTFFIDRSGRISEVVVGYHDYAALHAHATAAEPEGTGGAAEVPGAHP